MSETTATGSVHERYMAADAQQTEANRRFQALQAKGAVLTQAERLEKIALQDELADLAQLVPGLERQVLLEQNKLGFFA